MLVKTAHKNYPQSTVLASPENRGGWTSANGIMEDVQLLAVKFKDLQMKQFISTCSASTDGPPRATKHCGLISRPQVAYDYLKHAAGIDIHNHVRTGSLGLEDVWRTVSPHTRQFAGVLGFIFTNSYLAMKYFQRKDTDLKHADFKMELANQMVKFEETVNPSGRRSSILLDALTDTPIVDHDKRSIQGSTNRRLVYMQAWKRYTQDCEDKLPMRQLQCRNLPSSSAYLLK